MKKIAVLLLFMAIFLVSCNDSGDMTQNSTLWADIYYRSESKTIDSEPFAITVDNNLKKVITQALNQMCEEPVSNELAPALPSETEVIKLNIKDGCAELELSEEYLTLSEIDKTIANTCMLKTISNFIRVKELSVVVEGISQAVQFTEDLAELDEPKVYSGTEEIELYLYNRIGELTKTKVSIERKDGVLPEKVALEMLISGNASYTSPIPRDAKINSVSVSAGLCSIDFSQEFLNCADDKADEMLQAIVLTQTSIDYIDRVKITINGEAVRGFEKTNLAREYRRENFLNEE